MFECAKALRARGLPRQVREKSGDFEPLGNSIKVMTMHASKGLEFSRGDSAGCGADAGGRGRGGGRGEVVLCGSGEATQRLPVTVSGDEEKAPTLLP